MITDKTYVRFAIVGVINTIVGMAIMFFCYNVIGMSYWWSSAANYFFGSILSYFLNKNYTFGYGRFDLRSAMRFTLNIIICYVIAYAVARPLVRWVLPIQDKVLLENFAMFTGSVIFVVLNYLGQRFFAFRKENER